MGLFDPTSPPAGENIASLTWGLLKGGSLKAQAAPMSVWREEMLPLEYISNALVFAKRTAIAYSQELARANTILLVCNSSPF